MTRDEFNTKRKRLSRQLGERWRKVNINHTRPQKYFENKRLEFVAFIDEVLKTDWFIMPKPGTNIYNLYHNTNDQRRQEEEKNSQGPKKAL